MSKCRPCVITLLTDFGYQDAYVGIIKGVITGINPVVKIIDICHNVSPQNILNGAYLLYTSYKYFPAGTIHVAIVDPGVGSKRDIVCVKTRNYLFVVPNNGILSFVVKEEKPEYIIRITNNKYFLPSISNTFHGRDIFAPVAAYLSLEIKLRQLGKKINQLELLDILAVKAKNNEQLEGNIIYVDRFGNLITNITKQHIKSLEINYKYLKILIGKKKIVGMSKNYADVNKGKPLALFGSTGFLEISISHGNAQKYFKVNKIIEEDKDLIFFCEK